MNKVRVYSSLSVVFFLASCTYSVETMDDHQEANDTNEVVTESVITKADSILKLCVNAHGGDLYDQAHYAFSFRDKDYEFQNDGISFVYKREFVKEGTDFRDILDNGTLSRSVDGEAVELSKKDAAKYSSSVNSVIYFATLPHKLQDVAVQTAYGGVDSIKGVKYDLLNISFKQEGGGEDFDDKFLYWINSETHLIEYLAYSYKVNEGGVRFRSAYNTRTVEGIIFQDYVNYEAHVSTPLEQLSSLYEANQLKELSRIETENVRAL